MEALGVFGFCFGSLGFILSTIPSIAKAGDSFQNCTQKFTTYRRRLFICEAKYRSWEMKWKAFQRNNFDKSIIDDTVAAIQNLSERIGKEVDQGCEEENEKKFWCDFRNRLHIDGKTRIKLKEYCSDLRHAVGYVLFKKELIEGWIVTLEEAVKDIEQISVLEFQNLTLDHFGANPSYDQREKTKKLHHFMHTLKNSAESLYESCIGVQGTDRWALGLRLPDEKLTVTEWDLIANINIELRFFVQRGKSEVSDEFQLRARYGKGEPETHDYKGKVESAILNRTGANNTQPEMASTNLNCSPNLSMHRSVPIGKLLEEKSIYFGHESWKVDRVSLVYGLVHWALLLWDTSWFENLCCFGLQTEIEDSTPGSVMHMFTSGLCTATTTHGYHQRSRLRNLGIALAEIMLAGPLWWENDDIRPKINQWKDNRWRETDQFQIVEEILKRTSSIPLSRAIEFCLEEESDLANEPFQPEYLFRCIPNMYELVKEWYKTESLARSLRVTT